MKKLLCVIVCFLALYGICWATESKEDYSSVLNLNSDYIISAQSGWIIPNELIKRLNLNPKDHFRGSSLSVSGEDGNSYDWCYILKKHMDWVEKKLLENK